MSVKGMKYRGDCDTSVRVRVRVRVRERVQHTPISPRVLDGIGPVTEPPSNKRADAQHELLQGRDPPPDARVRDLPLVDGNDHDQEPSPQPGDGPASPEPLEVLCGRLEGAADDEDQRAQEDCPPPAEVVADRAGEHGAEEGASCEEGDDDSA